MKKYILTTLALCLFAFYGEAQYVTIPDSAFAAFLNTTYPQCMAGNQLDTTCSAVLNDTILQVGGINISDLTGIEYFKSLRYLDCSSNPLDSLVNLPSTLTYLNCSFCRINFINALPPILKFFKFQANLLSQIPALPSTLQYFEGGSNYIAARTLPTLSADLLYLSCPKMALTSLPSLPPGLKFIDCGEDSLTSLPPLPSAIETLICVSNRCTALPALPNSLVYLDCAGIPATSLPTLSASLKYLQCSSNTITALPALPTGLLTLRCDGNPLFVLPALPSTLQQLECQGCHLSSLPTLPASLTTLLVSSNPLTSLPALPSNLRLLYCSYTPLTNLPSLPLSLNTLQCSFSKITSLPTLPSNLSSLSCSYDSSLTYIPNLPHSIFQLICNNDINLTCLPEIGVVTNFLAIARSGIQCLSNYGSIAACDVILDSIPLCGLFSSYGCNVFWNVSGKAFYDQNSNCAFDTNDIRQSNVKILLDSAGTIVQQVYTGAQGYYSFAVNYGTYKTRVDTTVLPFKVSCPFNGYRTSIISAADSLDYDYDFSLTCRSSGFDLGVNSILNAIGTPRPNATVTINTIAGDIAQLYSAHCAASVAGTVTLTFNGPVTYSGIAAGALPPTTVNGNTITWNIADFGSVNDYSAFNILLHVNTNAQAGQQICITATVTPNSGTDYRPGNNTLSYCFNVVASFDPNEKEVYPAGNIDISQKWLTYTVRFQNTGTASAEHIYVDDTLDSHFDLSSFQLLAYSHENLTQILPNGIARFNFPNINLPDSLHNEPESHGYVQYKIKLKDNLPTGTVIKNTAHIYFDFNSPVVTNTVEDTITCTPDTIDQFGGLCAGDSLLFYGHWLHSPGSYSFNLPGQNGQCDTLASIFLAVQDPLPGTHVYDTICANDSILFSGAYYHTAGTYYSNGSHCASWFIMHLTVRPIDTIEQFGGLCAGDTILFYGHVITSPNYYEFTLQGQNGDCDTLATLTLAVQDPLPGTHVYDTICHGDSILFSGAYYHSTGVYYSSGSHCASWYILHLTVLPTPTGHIATSICYGDSIVFGHWLYATGTYYDTLTAANGCDSVLMLDLTVLPAITTDVNASICNGNTYLFNGTQYSAAGNYSATFASSGTGCDSVVTLHLSVTEPDTLNGFLILCPGDSVDFYGVWISSPGYYDTILPGLNGHCDTFATLSIPVIDPLPPSQVSQTICTGDSFYFDGNYLNTTGVYTGHFTPQQGCDSTVILTLTVTPVFDTTVQLSICTGDSITYHGHTYHAATTFTDTLTATGGCDSVVTVVLSLNPLPVVTFTWHSLIQSSVLHTIYYNQSNITIYCWRTGSPDVVHLLGGSPTGGNYTGYGISANSILADSIDYQHATYSLDTIYYTYTDNNGCSATVSDTFLIAICEGINDVTDGPAISVYPNPASSILYIKPAGTLPGQMKLYNVTGQLLIQGAFAPQLDISNLSSGIYLLMFNTPNGNIVRRFVKE